MFYTMAFLIKQSVRIQYFHKTRGVHNLTNILINKNPYPQQGQNVGVITTSLSTQLLDKNFIINQLPLNDFESTVIDNRLEVVFIDSTLYEIDHEWYGIEFLEILKMMNKLDVNIIIINNDDSYIFESENYFIINIDYKSKEIVFENNSVNLPILLDGEKYNPINKKTNLDVLYLKIGKLARTEHIQLFHKQFKPRREELVYENLDSNLMLELFKKIKETKVLFIYYSESISRNLLKYIEVAASLQNVTVILEHTFEITSDSSSFNIINVQDDESNMNYIRSFSKTGKFKEINNIKRHRTTYLSNTTEMYPKLYEILNGNYHKTEITVSVVTSTKRKNTLPDYIKRLNKQNYVTCEIVLLTHGFKLTEKESDELRKLSVHPIILLDESQTTSFGNCLNKCLDNVSYEYFAKVDDDDFYYGNYLIDNWIAQSYSKADLVGKHSQFVYLESNELVIQRFSPQQYRYSQYIAGATIFGKVDFVKQFMFSDLPRAVDSDLLRRVLAKDGVLYCGHPYEFCIFRDDDKEAHTWQISDTRLLKSAKIHFYGNPIDTLEISNN